MAASRIFSNDKHGLTGNWYTVPDTGEEHAMDDIERRKMLARDRDIRINQNQLDLRRERYAQRGSSRHKAGDANK